MKWKCMVCELIFEADAPKECPACKAAEFKLKRIEYRVKDTGWEY